MSEHHRRRQVPELPVPPGANPLVRGLARLSRSLAVGEGAGLGFFLVTLALLATWQFLARNLNNNHVPFPRAPLWVDGTIRHAVFFIGFLGAAFATHSGKHIRIDAVTRQLRGRGRLVARVVSSLLPLTICALCISAGWEFHAGEASSTDLSQAEEVINSARGSLAIPVGFGLILFHLLVHVAVDAAWLLSGQEPPAALMADAHAEGLELVIDKEAGNEGVA